MNRVSIALVMLCLAASQLPAQTIWPYLVNYNHYDELYNLRNFYSFWTSLEQPAPPRPLVTGNSAPTPAPAPATPVVHEYHWPDQGYSSAAFSIVTTNGTEYLATMVWVEGQNVRFNSVDGGTRQVPLISVSRSLTQIANAHKNLYLPLPPIDAGAATPADGANATKGATFEAL